MNEPELPLLKTIHVSSSKLTAYEHAETLMSEYKFISDDSNEIYIYRDGYYVLDDGGRFTKSAYRDKALTDYSDNIANSVVNQIAMLTYKSKEEFNNRTNIINFKNGLLNLTTGTLCKHQEDYISTIRIPHDYIANSELSVYINELLETTLQPGDILPYKEYIGYLMSLMNSYKKAALLYGPKDTGKTIIQTIALLAIGENNVAMETLDSLTNNRFSTYNLKNKVLCSADDIDSAKIYRTSIFKNVTGGYPWLNGERKYFQPTKFKNITKLLFSANKLPEPYDDDDDAFYDRWQLFMCKNVVKDKQPLNEIIGKISEKEIVAFISECVKAFMEVMRRGFFTPTISGENVKEAYMISANPLEVFLERCTISGCGEVNKMVFLIAFNAWGKLHGVKSIDHIRMGKLMGKHGYDGKSTRGMWQDIMLKEH